MNPSGFLMSHPRAPLGDASSTEVRTRKTSPLGCRGGGPRSPDGRPQFPVYDHHNPEEASRLLGAKESTIHEMADERFSAEELAEASALLRVLFRHRKEK